MNYKIKILVLFCLLALSKNASPQNSYGWERIFNSYYGINGFYVLQGYDNFKFWLVRPVGDMIGTGNYDFIKYNLNSNSWHSASHSAFRAVYYSYYIGYTESGFAFPHSLAISPLDTNFLLVNTIVSHINYPPIDIRLFYSYDNGTTNPDIESFRGKNFYGLAINPGKDSVDYAYSSDTIFKSVNRGITWTSVSIIPRFTNGYLTVSPIDTNFVYAVYDSLYISSNGGVSFQYVLNNKFNRIIFNFSDSTLLSISKNKFYTSSDFGYNWNIIDSLSDSINVIDTDPVNENIIYAGTKKGLYKSTNSGADFFLFNNSFSPSRNVTGLCKEANEDFVYVVTDEAVYKCWNSYIVGIEELSNVYPESFELYQNFPNPFNPSTTVFYRISKSNHVSLTVFDILGNKVASLVDQKQNAGTYNVEFNSSNHSSGVYFYRLSLDGFIVDTKRMVLLK